MKFQITGHRRGEVVFKTEYTPRKAAKEAVKMAKRGFETKVLKDDGKKAWMTCTPDRTRPAKRPGSKIWPDEVAVVHCTIGVASRKQIKDRKANR